MAEAKRIDGKAFAEKLVDRITRAVADLEARHGLKPGLAGVIVGEDPASQIYVRNKGERTHAAGMRSDTHRLSAETSQDQLLALIAELNGGEDQASDAGFYESSSWSSIDEMRRRIEAHGFTLDHRVPFTVPWAGEQLVLAGGERLEQRLENRPLRPCVEP